MANVGETGVRAQSTLAELDRIANRAKRELIAGCHPSAGRSKRAMSAGSATTLLSSPHSRRHTSDS